MQYKKQIFHVENMSTERLAKKFATPLYCYSYLKLKSNIINFKNLFKKINPLVCFSLKSNSNIKILSEIKNPYSSQFLKIDQYSGDTLISWSQNGMISYWDLKTNKVLTEIRARVIFN